MKKFVAIFAMIAVTALNADVILPKIINSHMVLQREAKVPIWGWADQGEEVTMEDTVGMWRKIIKNESYDLGFNFFSKLC